MRCVRAFQLALLIPILLLSHTVSEAQSLSPATALSATTYSKTQIKLAWADPNPLLSGAQEGGYIVARATAAPTGWTKVFTSGPGVTRWSSTGLSAGTLYYYRVRAFAVVGGTTTYSPYSSYAAATTQSDAYPNPARNLTASALSATQIALKWKDRAGNEDGFKVQRAPSSTGPWNQIGYTQTNQVTFTNSGLTPATAYFYRVVATNSTGDSPPSNVATAITTADLTPPTVSITSPASGSVYTAAQQVTISASASDNVAVTLVEFYDGGILKGNATALPYTFAWPVTSADNGTHSWTAKAYDAANGSVSNPVSLTVNIGGADTTPPTTTSNAPAGWVGTNQTVTLTPSDGSGTGVAGTQYCTDASNSCTPATSGTSVAVSCAAGATCQTYVRYRSTDQVGNVEATQSALVRIDKAAPTNGSLTAAPGNAQVALSWSAFSDGGSGLTGVNTYKLVYASGAAPASCASGTQLLLGTATSFTHTGLTNGGTYSYRVCASDAAGNISTGATASATPQAPVAVDPTLVGFVPGIGTPRDVVVDPVKDLAYMASDQFGLAVVDVSNPAAPVAIGGANPPFYGNKLAVNGALAVVGSSAGLNVVDVSVPTAPDTVGFLSGFMKGVAMAGQYAYVLLGVSGTLPHTDLAVVDLHLPATPTIVGRVTLANGVDVKVVGSFAYVAAGGAGLQIVDVSNPAAPWIVSTLDTPGGAGSLAVANGHAYIADNSSLQVVNVGSPSNPYVVGALPTTSATAVAVTGSRLYVLDGSQLKIVDVTSPAAPLLLSSTDGRGAQRLAAAGTEAFLSSPSTGLSVIEASVPTAPVLLGNVSGGFENTDVAVAGSLAVVTGGSFGLKVLDVTVPTAPEVIGSLSGYMKAVAMASQYAYVLLGVSGTLPHTDLAVVDLHLPATPTIVGRVTLANGVRVKVVGSFAYVAAGGAGLQIVDVSNPAAPWIVSTLDTPGAASSLAVANGHAYIADRTSIQVINVSNPASPVFVGSLATTAATAVAVAGSRLYVLDGALFEVIDVTNPAAPVLRSATPNPGAQALDVTGTLAFLATPATLHTDTNPAGGLYVLDVSIPTTPTLVDHIIIPGLTRTVVATPSFVYAGDSAAIVDVIEIAP